MIDLAYAAPDLLWKDVHDSSSYETRVCLYERRIRGWFFDQARFLQENCRHAGFAILLVVFSYVESSQMYREGRMSKPRESKVFFRKGFRRIFTAHTANPNSLTNEHIKDIWQQARIGLFHEGTTHREVILDPEYAYAVGFDRERAAYIILNASKCLTAVQNDLSTYIGELRAAPTGDQTREDFQSAWECMHRKHARTPENLLNSSELDPLHTVHEHIQERSTIPRPEGGTLTFDILRHRSQPTEVLATGGAADPFSSGQATITNSETETD